MDFGKGAISAQLFGFVWLGERRNPCIEPQAPQPDDPIAPRPGLPETARELTENGGVPVAVFLFR